MAKILIAEDEDAIRDALLRICRTDGHEAIGAVNGREAVELTRREQPDLLVLDNRMPMLSGLDALADIRQFDPDVVAVLHTAYDDADDVRRAVLELRAYGYIIKGSNTDAVRTTIHNALRSKGLEPRQEQPAQVVADKEPGTPDFGLMIGRSEPMLAIYDLISRIAHSDVTVLIQGESGTGKELVARAIADTSRRCDGPYVTIDCGTLPDTLTESEIFGHEAGAFTDARKSRPGKMELADGGTLFLDEIGNLSHSAQAKLLRVLEDRRVTRLGGQTTKTVDVRVITATNIDLEVASRDKTFREDLYYRLNVFRIQLPTLRERKEDLPLLVESFLGRFRQEQRKALPGGILPAAMALLQDYDWPGNVRELRNVLERAVLLADDAVGPTHLPLDMSAHAPLVAAGSVMPMSAPARTSGEAPPSGLPQVDLEGVPLKEAKRLASQAVERAYLLEALRQSDWNKSKAARLLDLNYKTLREKVRDYDLERLRYEDEG
jgi:two-component system response regulator AtoC